MPTGLRRLYEIPISSPLASSRKPTSRLAPDPTSGERAVCSTPLQSSHQELPMLDVVMLALGLGFFILTLGYAYACERL